MASEGGGDDPALSALASRLAAAAVVEGTASASAAEPTEAAAPAGGAGGGDDGDGAAPTGAPVPSDRNIAGGAPPAVKLEDGTEGVADGAAARFTAWLKENGATYPKVAWPVRTTVGGVRGAEATGDIATGEHFLSVPRKLMISPPLCRASPEMGHVYTEAEELFAHDDDRVIAVYLVYEHVVRGADSFWAPYFDMLPWPGSVCDWTEAECAELQNERLVAEARLREPRLLAIYNRLFQGDAGLCARYPALFPLDKCTLHEFKWAWGTIQARAFGRRLPWTALVPFADCLNHANVGIKYDYDVGANGVFRMFPTAGNAYGRGAEVFNSYGRRDNRHLLIEYGFAMENNEWESIELRVSVPVGAPDYMERTRFITKHMFSPSKMYRIFGRHFGCDAMPFFRLLVATEEEKLNEAALDEVYTTPLSADNELRAMVAARAAIANALAAHATTIAEDEALLRRGGEEGATFPPRLTAAVVYRLTRKRLLQQQLDWWDAVIALARVAAAQAGPLRSLRDPVMTYLGGFMDAVRPCAKPKPRAAPPAPVVPAPSSP